MIGSAILLLATSRDSRGRLSLISLVEVVLVLATSRDSRGRLSLSRGRLSFKHLSR